MGVKGFVDGLRWRLAVWATKALSRRRDRKWRRSIEREIETFRKHLKRESTPARSLNGR